jgi:malonyl-CoA/methylmalonyl-CoA synthetase
MTLFPNFAGEPNRTALRFGEQTLSYGETAAIVDRVKEQLAASKRVAVWAEPRIETALAVVAALDAGIVVVPINPRLGELELQHEVSDSAPDTVLTASDADLPGVLDRRRRVVVDPSPPAASAPLTGASTGSLADTDPAMILYTSGTTGLPKGVILSRRAIASNLDALATAWAWTSQDVVVQALPLFHGHGLVLGVLGTLRRAGTVHHLGRFDPKAVCEAFASGGTALFAVPTMYHRLGNACEEDPSLASDLARARILVSGSAPLPAREHERFERLTGQKIVERYGLTEALIICSVRHDGDRRAGYVGRPLDGVEFRLVDDDGQTIETHDDETIGEIAVRGPALFDGYLNRPDATMEVMRNGWLVTGDMATRSADGYVRIVGRRSTDMIKTGGYRVGAGEVEAALAEHPDVQEAAVMGRPDEEFGERIVAWVVPRGGRALNDEELFEHVRRLLSWHKCPREIHVIDELPRNALGKVQKKLLST